jgi:hypothetical protein
MTRFDTFARPSRKDVAAYPPQTCFYSKETGAFAPLERRLS